MEALDGGSDSPPQVGGGVADVFTTWGVGVVRRATFDDTDAPTWDRDLTPVDPDPDELIATSLSSGVDDSGDGCTFLLGSEAGLPPVGNDPVGGKAVFGIGATEYRSVRALRSLPDWLEWEQAIRPELDHAVKVKKALTLRSNTEFHTARRRFRDCHEVLNLVTPCVVKHDANGKVLRRKFRITAADAKGRAGSLFDAETYSGAIDAATVRFLDNLTLGRGGRRRNLDAKSAYFEGRKIPQGRRTAVTCGLRYPRGGGISDTHPAPMMVLGTGSR
jgi:hypothetical protein